MFRLDIFTSNMMRCKPQFAATLKVARKIKKELKEVGYQVAIFQPAPNGGFFIIS